MFKKRETKREVICFKVSALMGCKGPIIKIWQEEEGPIITWHIP